MADKIDENSLEQAAQEIKEAASSLSESLPEEGEDFFGSGEAAQISDPSTESEVSRSFII